MEKLKKYDFITKKGIPLQNQDLLQILIGQIESHTIEFVKVKAHQNFEEADFNSQIKNNSEVDKMTRLMIKEAVKRTF
jgi:hypothetical protein